MFGKGPVAAGSRTGSGVKGKFELPISDPKGRKKKTMRYFSRWSFLAESISFVDVVDVVDIDEANLPLIVAFLSFCVDCENCFVDGVIECNNCQICSRSKLVGEKRKYEPISVWSW